MGLLCRAGRDSEKRVKIKVKAVLSTVEEGHGGGYLGYPGGGSGSGSGGATRLDLKQELAYLSPEQGPAPPGGSSSISGVNNNPLLPPAPLVQAWWAELTFDSEKVAKLASSHVATTGQTRREALVKQGLHRILTEAIAAGQGEQS